MLAAALIGFTLGFVTSVPVAGPISILVFSRGLQERSRGGAYLACGAALAEATYAFFAFWGFAELLVAYPWLEPLTGAAAAVILLALGLRFATAAPERRDLPEGKVAIGRRRNFLLGLTIAGLNPTLLATWPAMVTFVHSLGLIDFEASHALPFSSGVALGISGWFFVLLWLLSRYRGRFSRSTLDKVVRFMGIVLTLLGVGAAVRFGVFIVGML